MHICSADLCLCFSHMPKTDFLMSQPIPYQKLEFMFMKHYAPNRCEPSIEFRTGLGGQGRCEQRSEVFVKIQKKKIFFFFGGGGEWVRSGRGGGGGGGSQGGCKQRIEVFVKIQKKKNWGGGGGWGSEGVGDGLGWGGGGWGVRVDVTEK